MSTMWYKIGMFFMLFNSFIAIFQTPQFNPWDKFYDNPDTIFDQNNGSTIVLNTTAANAFFGRSNLTSNASLRYLPPGYLSIQGFSEGGVLGWLVSIFTIILQIFIFVIAFFWYAYTGVFNIILSIFGSDMMPFAVLIQAMIDVVFTWGIIQLLTARGGKIYE